MTRVQTPRFWGAPRRAGVFDLDLGVSRPLRTSWLTVGMLLLRNGWRLLHTARPAGTPAPANRGRGMVANTRLSAVCTAAEDGIQCDVGKKWLWDADLHARRRVRGRRPRGRVRRSTRGRALETPTHGVR